MDFVDKLKQFSKRVESLLPSISTEEATKTAIVMPFFSMLGYDVFNPSEFSPEYTADVGIKKGEKVDYAIIQGDQPVILIECKAITEPLEKHDSQLFRYFGTSTAKFAILTNGLQYRFYTDLDNQNKMDETPFLSIDILNVKENQILELKKFCKSEFNVDSIFSTASELKYADIFKGILKAQLDNPSDDFIRFFLQNCYSGQKTQSVLEKFRSILKKALNDYISETMNDKIKLALSRNNEQEADGDKKNIESEVAISESIPELKDSKIITTEEELEAYFIIKNLLADIVNIHDVTYKDRESYLNILYQGNSRKRICRLILSDKQKTLFIPDENKQDVKYSLKDIYELHDYKEQLKDCLRRYII